uniref:Uncharacterized protein n=1 Tax=Micrurus paraensis TaxID=1970185 RepID=A0A2D4KL10_9SAUR
MIKYIKREAAHYKYTHSQMSSTNNYFNSNYSEITIPNVQAKQSGTHTWKQRIFLPHTKMQSDLDIAINIKDIIGRKPKVGLWVIECKQTEAGWCDSYLLCDINADLFSTKCPFDVCLVLFLCLTLPVQEYPQTSSR